MPLSRKAWEQAKLKWEEDIQSASDNVLFHVRKFRDEENYLRGIDSDAPNLATNPLLTSFEVLEHVYTLYPNKHAVKPLEDVTFEM
jgi:hypothetical protein